MNDKTKGCLALLSVPFFMAAGMVTYAWAAQTLWNWFAVPLGAPPVTMAQAYGLSALLWLLTSHYQKSEKNDDDGIGVKVLKLATIVFVRPALSVGVAWLVRGAAS